MNALDPLKLTESWYWPDEIPEKGSNTIVAKPPVAPVVVPTIVPLDEVSVPVNEDGVGVPDKAVSLMFS